MVNSGQALVGAPGSALRVCVGCSFWECERIGDAQQRAVGGQAQRPVQRLPLPEQALLRRLQALPGPIFNIIVALSEFVDPGHGSFHHPTDPALWYRMGGAPATA